MRVEEEEEVSETRIARATPASATWCERIDGFGDYAIETQTPNP